MRKSLMTVVAVAVLAAPAPVLALQTSGDKADMDRIICKRESVIGSRAQKKKTCMTRREWIQRANSARDRTDEFIRDVNAASPTKS